jgi:predicted AlkP superfamily phosphohydrolase/phosphomutase
MNTSRARRVLVIGLDCAAPKFVFGPGAFDLPNLRSLMECGARAMLRSCDPPITVPAWSVMTSGLDPGQLGIYGFRNRPDHSYAPMRTSTSSDVHALRLWDRFSSAGMSVVVAGVPQTWPPRPVHGLLVSDFLTPESEAECTYPKSLKAELERAAGEYILDVKDYRTDDKRALLPRIYAVMNNRFDTLEYMLKRSAWSLAIMVEIGLDRLHHAFWRYCDPDHPHYAAGNPFEHAFRDYYMAIDNRIGRLLKHVNDDDAVLVVSDHGAKPLIGGFRINQWLINEGYLVLKSEAREGTAFSFDAVDWLHTRVWSEGGYYARIFINRAGREPDGIVSGTEYEGLRNELVAKLEAIQGPDGLSMGNRVYRPESLYRDVNGVAPDLLAYFGNLSWRSVGTIGHDSVYARRNDSGPDDANHDFHGIFVLRAPGIAPTTDLGEVNILDVAPTLLEFMGLPIDARMTGKSLFQMHTTQRVS